MAGKAAILVPFALAADDHQRTNARALEAAGAARMLEEKDLSGESLAAAVRALVGEPGRIAAMEEAARRLGRPDAAARVAELLPGTEDGPVLRKIQHVHFVGIGGSGMSGIAEVLLNLGYTVSGSDLKRSATTDRLASLGARVFEGHAAEHASGAHVVVTSTAVRPRQPRGGRGPPARRPRHPARRDAGRADAPQVRGRGGGQPRQDHDHLDGGARARPRRPRPHGGGGRAARRPRLRRAARARASSWWRRPTSRTARS